MDSIILSLGSNLGDRKNNLEEARVLLENYGVKILKASEIYETEPVGYEDQGYFLNRILIIDTEKDPEDLLELCLNIEKEMGRQRRIKNGPRNIDIDILFFKDKIISTDNLIVPHPVLHERRFILEPLAGLAPDEIHPVLGESMGELLSVCEDGHNVSCYCGSFLSFRPKVRAKRSTEAEESLS